MFKKTKEKLMNKWLAEDKLVCVPATWQKEYVKMAGGKVRTARLIQQLMDAYNELLLDFYQKHSIKELKDILKEQSIKIDTSWDKDELVKKVYEEFKMERQKD